MSTYIILYLNSTLSGGSLSGAIPDGKIPRHVLYVYWLVHFVKCK